MSLESGRYMETVGWMSAKLPPRHLITNTTSLNITRRYLDANRNTYRYHTKLMDFDTKDGINLSHQIVDLGKKYNITFQFGTAPQDYYLTRVPYPSESSVLSLFANQVSPLNATTYLVYPLRHTKVMPVGLAIANPARASVPFIAIGNAGSQRFDLLAGTFTRNDQFIVSPFGDAFFYVTVPFSVGIQILDTLNSKGTSSKRSADLHGETGEEYARGYVEGRFNAWMRDMWVVAYSEGKHVERADLTLGYVTKDVSITCLGSSIVAIGSSADFATWLRAARGLVMTRFTHRFHLMDPRITLARLLLLGSH